MRRRKTFMDRQGLRVFVSALACAIVAIVGCGARVTSVGGVVTLDGQPLGEALVQFFPSGPAGQTAATYTDREGRYQVAVAPVPFRVTIVAQHVVGQQKDDTNPNGGMVDVYADILPARYKKPESSSLRVEPAAGRRTVADFELSSKP